MKTVYPSKIGTIIILFLLLVVGRTVDTLLTTPFDAVLHSLYIAVTLFVIVLVFGFRYTIEGTQLTVSVAGIYKKHYDIMRISEIKASHTLIAAPACSINRLKIHCGGQILIISPRRKVEFVQQIRKINPKVKVTL